MPRKTKPEKLEWNKAYSKLATLLLDFYNEFTGKSPQLLFRLVEDQNGIISNENWFKNRKVYSSSGLDPIQVYASFNSFKQKSNNRNAIYGEWVEILNGGKNIYDIDFEGCPSPFNIKILSGRQLNDQLDIWNTFEQVHKKGKSALSDELLPKIRKWYGINLPSFTIFLYWIDCEKFISLDKNTTNYLLKTQDSFVVPTSLSAYLDLIETIPFGLHKTIVSVAFDSRLIERLTPSLRSKLDKFTNRNGSLDTELLSNTRVPFRLIAIQISNEWTSKYRKNLNDESYKFYQGYTIENEKIILDRSKLFDLYSDEKISISLNAIVGKNGSGKSALSELLFIAINNLYCHFLGSSISDDFHRVDGIHLELFYESYGIFQLVFADKTITAFEYLKVGENEYLKSEESTKIDKSFLEKFFYTLSVNYSLYGLNSSHLNTWLEKLFEKNDGYENPIVLEPNRVNGNIDIKRQEELVRSRFFSNLMEFLEYESLENTNIEQKSAEDYRINYQTKEILNSTVGLKSYRFVRDNTEVRSINLEINSEKTSKIFKKNDGTEIEKKSQIPNFDLLIKLLKKNFKLAGLRLDLIDFDDNTIPESICLRYIIKKIIKIARLYKPYVSFHWDWKNENIRSVDSFFKKLKTDQSHVTIKLFQALNFLQKKIEYFDGNFKLDEISAKIISSKTKHLDSNKNELKTIHLLPPSFFNIEIGIVDLSDSKLKEYPFEQLSSGERQQIYSINSIIYHLKNIDSVEFEGRIQYRCVNLVLDEVELYAHPEMQRKYVYELINLIKRVEWSNLSGINICFITHSPFILSDITSERIMFLNQYGMQSDLIKAKTFGANIHELLVDGFFLFNTIGEFALKHIEDIISFHSLVLNSLQNEIPELIKIYRIKRPLFLYVVENIGEDYIRGVLKNHITDIDKILDKNFFKKQSLKELEAEIELLKKEINAKD